MGKQFNYSYANIDIDNYLNDFKKNRNEEFLTIFNTILNHNKEYDQIILKINSNIKNGEKISFENKNEIDTISFLYGKYNYLICNNRLDTTSKEWIYTFQKKFELYNKLFSRYNKKTKLKSSKTEASIKVYIVLAIILFINHINNIDWNAFNSGTKLIDYIIYNKQLLNDSEKYLIQNIISLELYCIEDFLNKS